MHTWYTFSQSYYCASLLLPMCLLLQVATGSLDEWSRATMVSCLSIKRCYLSVPRSLQFSFGFALPRYLNVCTCDEAEQKCGKAVVKQVKDMLVAYYRCNRPPGQEQ